MYKTRLKKVGNSLMLTIPVPLLEMANITGASELVLDVKNREIVVAPTRPKYSLSALLKEHPPLESDADWISGAAVGEELI